MGYLDIKPPPLTSKSMASTASTAQNGPSSSVSQSELAATRSGMAQSQPADTGSAAKEQILRTKPADNRPDKTDNSSVAKSDTGHSKVKGGSVVTASETQMSMPPVASQSGAFHNDEAAPKAALNETAEAEVPLMIPNVFMALLGISSGHIFG